MTKSLFDRYKSGEYQQIWKEMNQYDTISLLNLEIQKDMLEVIKETMLRVRKNLEILVPRLIHLGFVFGDGFFDDCSVEEKEKISKDLPIYPLQPQSVDREIHMADHLYGVMPLSLRVFYEVVGSINLVGTHSRWRPVGPKGLDALFIYPLSLSLQMMDSYSEIWKAQTPSLPIAPDHYYKSGQSGSGTYSIQLPNDHVDAFVELEWHQCYFVQYLRNAFKWGGFPGLELYEVIPEEDVKLLTKDFLLF